MLGFLAPLFLKFSGLSAMLKSISPKVWLYIGAALLLVAGVIGHQVHAHHALRSADAAGYQRAKGEDIQAAAKVTAEAVKAKVKSDALNAQLTQQEQARYAQDSARNHALADALRVRVRPQVQPGSHPGANLPVAAGPSSSPGGQEPQADAGLAEVAALPLIDYAEQCDDDHAARIRLEDWWAELKKNWPH